LDASLLEIEADADQINRLLRNLVLNALDATGSGGRILVRTASRPGGIQIEVSDTGSGLKPEEQQRLFTPYYTTRHHGTGLGLAIVQSVVSDHGGRISVESQVGKGTTFRVDLSANR
jgi:signal transduction histidine kinase